MTIQSVADYTFTWTNITTTDQAPATDTIMNISRAESISISVDAAADANHTANDFDINVITCPTSDGTYDTTPYWEYYYGDDAVQTKLMNPGPKFAKLRLDENGALRADVTVKVVIRE